MITKKPRWTGSVCLAVLAVLMSGCAGGGASRDINAGGRAYVISPVTIVGRVSRVTNEGLTVVVLDPGELGNKTKPAPPRHLLTTAATEYLSAEVGPNGTLVPKTVTKRSIKAGAIVTIEARIEMDNPARVRALKVTVSPSPDIMAKTPGVDHSHDAVISGKVTTAADNGFEIDGTTGAKVFVVADATTPTMAGPPGISPSPADYVSVSVGVQVTVLGAWQGDGRFKAAQIAVTN